MAAPSLCNFKGMGVYDCHAYKLRSTKGAGLVKGKAITWIKSYNTYKIKLRSLHSEEARTTCFVVGGGGVAGYYHIKDIIFHLPRDTSPLGVIFLFSFLQKSLRKPCGLEDTHFSEITLGYVTFAHF